MLTLYLEIHTYILLYIISITYIYKILHYLLIIYLLYFYCETIILYFDTEFLI